MGKAWVQNKEMLWDLSYWDEIKSSLKQDIYVPKGSLNQYCFFMLCTDFVQTKVLTSTIFENLSPSGGFSERSYDWEGTKKLAFCIIFVTEYIEKKKKMVVTASKVIDTVLHDKIFSM